MNFVRAVQPRNSEGKKRAVLGVEGITLHYTGEVGNMIIKKFTIKAHHANVCDETVHFGKKWSSHHDALSHIDYEGHGYALTKHS